MEEKLPVLALQTLREHHRELEKMEAICQNLHPENVLRRGFSITISNGKVISSPAELKSGDLLETRLWEGIVKSEVV